MSENKPEKKFRVGAISAAIWLNKSQKDGKDVEYKTVSFQRSYKDENDKWQSTSQLRAADLPKAVLVLNKAYEYLSLSEAESMEV